MEKHIAGHTGKIPIETEAQARFIAKHNKFGKNMRAYKCPVEDHWHVTSMSKGLYYTSHRKDPRRSKRASIIPK